jgi:hypothetical protein
MLVPKDEEDATSVVSRSLASDGDVMMMVGTAAAELEGVVASSSARKSLQEKEVVSDDIIDELTSKISQGSNQEKMALTSRAREVDSRERAPRRRGGPTKMRGSRPRDCRHYQRLRATTQEIEANLEISDSGASEDSSASTMVASFCLCSGSTETVAAAVSFCSAIGARESRGSAEAKIIGGWEPSSSKSISESSRSSWLVRKSPSGLR